MMANDDPATRDLERRLARALHAAAPPAPGDLSDRLLRRTAVTPQRRTWSAQWLMPAVAVTTVAAVAVAVGLGIGGLLPSPPPPGTGPNVVSASASPSALPGTPTPTPTPTLAPSASGEPSPSATPDVFPGGSRCENPVVGYAVSYPAGWHANEELVPDNPALDPVAACAYFAEEPFEVRPNAGLQQAVAIGFQVLAEMPPSEAVLAVLSSREVSVGGRPATVRELESMQDLPFLAVGDRLYRYLIELDDGQVLQVSTDSRDRLGDYEAHKQVLDRMMETIDFDRSGS